MIAVAEEEAGGGSWGPSYTLYMNMDGSADRIMPTDDSPVPKRKKTQKKKT